MGQPDPLDRVLEVAGDLLARIDATLVSSGAPAAHPIWPLARRMGALPADAVDALAQLRPEPVRESSARLRSLAEAYAARHADLAGVRSAAGWEGAAGDAFAAQLGAFIEHLGPEGTTGALAATASYLDDVAAWIGQARRALAGVLATALTSAEAVSLCAGAGFGEVAAAAEIGARVLAATVEVYDAGRVLDERWAGRLGDVHYRPPADTAPPAGSTRAVLR
jgi:hypothetical protein